MSEAEEEKKDDTTKKGKKGAKEPKAAKEVSAMQKGDYTIHLLLQKGKDLDIPAEEVMNIMVEVQVQDQKENTKEFMDVTNTTVVTFDGHIFIELMNQSVASLEQTKIMIKLQAKGFFKTELIGQLELDLTYIYNLDNHTCQHKWFALINPDSEDFASVAAYMKLSGSVYGVNDTPLELKMDDGPDSEDCVMPASLKPKYTQLKLHVVKGENLPKLDVKMIGEGTMDAFITAQIGGKKIRTDIKVTEHDEATWNETLLIPVRMPIMSGKLILNVMDLDKVKDEQAGALIFDYKDLISRPQKSFFWANIYGAPGQEEVKLFDSTANVSDEMNKDPNKATKWKGRILMGVEYFESESPKCGVEKMSTTPPLDEEGNEMEGMKSIVELSQDYQKMTRYRLMYEFNSCINTPEKLGKYNLQLSIAEKTWTSEGGDKARAVGYNYNRWNQRSTEDIEIELPYGEVEDIGDIFLYLCPDKAFSGLSNVFGGKKEGENSVGKPISYMKLKASDFTDPNPKLQWVQMIEEPVEDALDSPELAGVVGFRLSLIKDDGVTILKDQPNWKKRLSRRPDSAKIRCYLFQCRDLPAADEDGASDPMVIVYNTVDQDSNKDRMKAQEQKTHVVENNCDPMFYELLELKIDYTKGEDLPPFILDVYDVDKKFIGDDDMDYLGRCVIDINDAAHKTVSEDTDTVDLKPEVPKWHPIRFDADSPKCGEILVSFILTEEFDHDWKVPNNAVKMMGIKDDSAVVRFDEYRVELNVLGLRGLLSPGLLPVKKAYIDFLLKSMVPPVAASALQSVATAPGPSGPDPTINAVISFSVPMPVNDLYAPAMACRVYDKVFKGFSGQLIGVFTIPIGQIMRDQRQEYDENCKSLDEVIAALEKALEQQAVLDYDPVNPNVDANLVDDKKFRADQRQQKAQIQKQMDRDVKEENKSFTAKIADGIAPEKEKPTTALAKRLDQGKKNQLKKRLLLHTDEDSDSSGEETTNPVALQDTDAGKYVPPSLPLGAINDSQVHDMDELSRTPRTQLTPTERRAVDREAILDAISNKSDPDKLKAVTPKNNEPFKPPSATRLSQQDVEDAIRERSGPNTPAAADRSIKQFTPSKSGVDRELVQMAQSEEAAIKRETESVRQVALKEHEAKTGHALKTVMKPKYQMDERLGCMKEYDAPNSLLFEALGWDRVTGETTEKHYRAFYPSELEHTPEVMSKPSEFQSFHLRKGQQRGAKTGLFGGGKKDESGEADTTQEVGLFKALITVVHKETEFEHKMFIFNKLAKIRRLLAELYTQRYNKPFPIAEGFFCENALEGSKVLTAAQRERAYSDDIQAPKEDTFSNKTGLMTSRSVLSMSAFDGKASTILNPEGRAMFKELTRQMKLGHLQIMRKIVDVQSDEIVKRLLMQESKCNVRAYVVRAFNLAARDNDSPSDSYVKVILGEDERDDRDNYQEDEASPDIYKMYEFQAIFPGCPLLKVQFWDYDLLFGDDFIGETIVDMEDRYFSSDFKSLPNKPIEHRKLSHPSTEMSQGTVVMWTEINEQYAPSDTAPIWDISKKPSEDYEVRVVIWSSEELKMMDAEGTTDGFVRCFFDSDDRKDTDTHFRNQDGKCSWNYRLLFPFTHPNKNYKLTVQAYDLDLFKSNDLAGECTIDLQPLFEDSELAKRPMSLTQDYYDEYLAPQRGLKVLRFEKEDKRQFWVELTGKDENGKTVVNGRLRMQIDILPKKEAEKNVVGEARSEPNVNPFLPQPEGRLEFSLNPFKMLNQLIGPALRRKIYCWCCICILCALCVMMAPMIFSNMISNMLTPG